MNKRDFWDFYSRYRGYSVNIARAVLGDREAAEDICQEAFARLYNIRDRLDNSSESRIKALVYFTTYNKCLDYCRKIYRKLEAAGMKGDIPDEGMNPETLILKREDAEHLRMALKRFREQNPRSYDILVKTEYLGIPAAKVAAEYGIKKCNVHNCVYKARKWLNTELRKLRR